MSTYKIIGFTDSVRDCDCCGKSELKGTYAIEIDGEQFYYGSVCASKAINVGVKEIKAEVSKIKLSIDIDNEMNLAKSEYAKTLIYRKAIKKGISNDYFFLKYGKLSDIFSNQWQNVYEFASFTHSIPK